MLIQFEIGLDDLESLINRLNTEMSIGLVYHGRDEGVAIWSAGNYLIIARRVMDIRLTELETTNLNRRMPDKIAENARDNLIERLKRSEIPYKGIRDLERLAKKTLANFYPSQTNLTVEQAVKEMLNKKMQTTILEPAAHADSTKKPEKPQEAMDGTYDDAIKRFGTDKDLSLSDVKGIVKRCNAFVKNGGKVAEFCRQYSQDKYQLETLRKWRKDSRFAD